MKQVRETSAGKSISSYIILGPGKDHVATVQAHFSDSGTVLVNVWDRTSLVHERRATGGGYDKFAAALSGAVIDGVKIYDQSETDETLKSILSIKSNPDRKLAELAHGARLANWDGKKYLDCYYIPGLDRLGSFGYTIIKAI